MIATTPLLDPQELLHLALLASQENQHDRSISLLKQGLSLTPEDPKFLFLLGAEHAQIGLYDRAIEEISHSVRQDASVPAAHFQLGLLYMMRGDGAQAREAWLPLGVLEAADPFRVFSDGLLRLLENDLAGCIAQLRHGLSLSGGNPALAGSMERILASALAAQEQGAAGAGQVAVGQAGEGTAASEHVFLSAYQTR